MSAFEGKKAKERERQEELASTRTAAIRHQADDEYDESDEYDDDLARKAAGKGCLITFLVFLLILLGIGGYGALYVNREISGKRATATATVAMDVESNTTARKIGKKLLEEGMIANENIFRLYTKIKGVGSGFQVGRFYLEPGMSYDEIIETLSEAPPPRDVVTVMIPEGSTVYQFAKKMEEAGLCTAEEFIEEANNGDFSDIKFFQYLDQDPDTYMRAEGYLAPDTYEFFVDESVHNIVHRLYENFDSWITPEMYARMDEQGMSLRDAVTFASVVEEEAGLPEHQPAVAGVFWNRLYGDLSQTDLSRRTLGSDVTFYYIRDWIARDYGGNYEDVPDNLFYGYYSADDDPQTREGLPAGPISSPSRTALEAALWPEMGKNFYFLTDFYGTYYYAQYYSQHSKNVATMNRMNAQWEAENGTAEDTAGGS